MSKTLKEILKELLGQEVVFVFTKDGKFKGVYNYKE